MARSDKSVDLWPCLQDIALPDFDDVQIPDDFDLGPFASALLGETPPSTADDEATAPAACDHLSRPMSGYLESTVQSSQDLSLSTADHQQRAQSSPTAAAATAKDKMERKAEQNRYRVPALREVECRCFMSTANEHPLRQTHALTSEGVEQACLPATSRPSEAAEGGRPAHDRGHGSADTVAAVGAGGAGPAGGGVAEGDHTRTAAGPRGWESCMPQQGGHIAQLGQLGARATWPLGDPMTTLP